MKIELNLKSTNSQFLGIVNDKEITIEKDHKLILDESEWNLIRDRKWNVKMIESGVLEVKEIDKKVKRMEKEIKEGTLTINE